MAVMIMKAILDYLRKHIDEKAVIEEWNAKDMLSLQLASSYEYYIVSIFSEQFLLIKPIDAQTTRKTAAHIDVINKKTKFNAAVLLENATPYMIKKMLEEKIAFLAVDRQMYLPFLALHIRMQSEKKKEMLKRDRFTAATQMVFLAFLYSDSKEMISAAEMADNLGLSAMTILRASDELMALGILEFETSGKTGRKKVFKITDRKKFYRIGKEHLINPVKKTIYVSDIPDNITLYIGGLTALAEQTMLGDPDRKVFAVSFFSEGLKRYQVSKERALEENLYEIQIMKYDIGKLTTNKYVDIVTLICSLNEMDDRIEIAIEELIGDMEWYEA